MAEQDETTERKSREREVSLLRLATYASVGVASTLILAKLGAWFATGSVSILSSLVDSMLDLVASVVNLLAVRHALQPADREHRFGHGKAEALAGLGQAAFIGGSGLFVLMEGIGRLYNPQPIEHGVWGIGVMIVSMFLTGGLVAVQKYVMRRASSLAIHADSFHYQIDLVTNAAVIGSLGLSAWFGLHFIDPLVALGIVAYMAFGSWGIARQAVDQLMDRELPDDERNRIREIALAEPAVRSVHDLRTRASGSNRFIQIHLEMDRDLSLIEAHEISDQVMYNIEAAFPNSEVLVHQDPEGVEERRDTLVSAGGKR
jgi:ferrous-iron efflux pump FieF